MIRLFLFRNRPCYKIWSLSGLLFQVEHSLKMFKFIKAKGPHQSAERQKLQKELFSYRRVSAANQLLLIFLEPCDIYRLGG